MQYIQRCGKGRLGVPLIWTIEMASNKGQSSCVTYLWISFLVVGIVPGVVSNVALTSIPSTTQPICPGETIEFTCTIESSILLWTSDEYIGVSNQFEFRIIDPIGTTATTNVAAIANLTENNSRMLTSTLRIDTVASQSSTITCINGDDRTSNTSTVQVAAVPGTPQNVMAVGSMDDCMIRVTWDPPDTGESDYTYRVNVSSRNITADTNSSTESTLRVPNCADGIIPVQVYVINQFGCMESSETQLRLESGSSTNGLSGSVVGGIIGGVFAVFIICCIIVFAVIFMLYKDIKRRKKKEAALKEDLVRKEFGAHLGSLYDALKLNEISSIQADVRRLLELKKQMKSDDIREALKSVLEAKITTAIGIQLVLCHLEKMIPEVMSYLLEKVDSPTLKFIMKGPTEGAEKPGYQGPAGPHGNPGPLVRKGSLNTSFLLDNVGGRRGHRDSETQFLLDAVEGKSNIMDLPGPNGPAGPHEKNPGTPTRKISTILLVDAARGESNEKLVDDLKKDLKEVLVKASPEIVEGGLLKLFEALQEHLDSEATNLEVDHQYLSQDFWAGLREKMTKVSRDKLQEHFKTFMESLQLSEALEALSPPDSGGPGVERSRRPGFVDLSVGGLSTLHENISQDDDTKEEEHIV